MKQRWTQLAQRYAALPHRERVLLPAAVCFAILMLGYLLLIEPARMQRVVLQQQLQVQTAELAVTQAQLDLLRARVADPDAALKAQLAALRTQAHDTEAQFRQLQGSLVPPQEMTQWLSGLLQAQRGLHLVGLRSLAPTSVGEMVQKRTPAAASAPETAASAAAAADDAWLYRHGVELTVRGSYQELLAFLHTLERMPRRVYWGELRLDASASPAIVMTLTVHTLSVEKTWWLI